MGTTQVPAYAKAAIQRRFRQGRFSQRAPGNGAGRQRRRSSQRLRVRQRDFPSPLESAFLDRVPAPVDFPLRAAAGHCRSYRSRGGDSFLRAPLAIASLLLAATAFAPAQTLDVTGTVTVARKDRSKPPNTDHSNVVVWLKPVAPASTADRP